MSERRDTHFIGFARKVAEEIYGLDGWYMEAIYDDMQEEFAEVIARRAYDLACHVVVHTQLTAHGDMSKIPDLTELPKE